MKAYIDLVRLIKQQAVKISRAVFLLLHMFSRSLLIASIGTMLLGKIIKLDSSAAFMRVTFEISFDSNWA